MREKIKSLFSRPLGYTKLDETIIGFCEKYLDIIFLAVIAFLGMYMRIRMFPFFHSDLTEYFIPWYDQLKADGGLAGLKYYTGDYNYPFPTMLALLTYLPVDKFVAIKSLSIFFDVVLAVFAGLIAEAAYGESMKFKRKSFVIAFAFTFLSPLVMLDSAYWGQNDSIYVSFVFIAIYLMIKDKYFWSLFVYGIAFAVKIQALFIFPLFVLIYFLNKKFSFLYFFSIAFGFIAASLPGMIISGEGLGGCIRIYMEEVGEERWLSQNFPNIYYWFSAKHYDLYKVLGICFTLFVFIIVCYYLYRKGKKLNADGIIGMGIWCVLTCVYLLPKMHKRYGMIAEILCMIWILGHKKWVWYPILMNTIILFCYFAVLHGYYLYYFQNMAVINIICYAIFSYFILMGKDVTTKIKTDVE